MMDNRSGIKCDLAIRLESELKPILEKDGLELFDIVVKKHHGISVIDILIDRTYGGVTIAECAKVNKTLARIIEDEHMADNFSLEVSSPGFERPLKTKKDFLRVKDRKVRVIFNEPQDDKTECKGDVQEAFDDHVIIKQGTEDVDILFTKIKKASQII